MEISLINYYRALLEDLGVSPKEISYLIRRLRNEGISVLTVVLPAFSKHVLHCLEQGFWVQFSFGGGCPFAARRGGLPEIFQGFLREIFSFNSHTKVWEVCSSPDPISLWALRQACEIMYKLAIPFTDDQLEKAGARFWETDCTVHTKENFDVRFVDAMRKNFETHYPSSSRLTVADCVQSSRNGPGTFAGKKAWEEATGLPWWVRNYLPVEVPYDARHYAYAFRLNKRWPIADVRPCETRVSEVLFVPKDSRGPRVIVREPYHNLLVQMGFNSQMTAALERDTRNRINFASQHINRELARQSSITRQYATLDLKDASDRVSFAVTRHLFRFIPLRKILAFRTPYAKLGGSSTGEPRELNKLAGMGSGLTFPTMALIIHLAICTSVSRGFGLTYRSVMDRVYVYGDDIIVPTAWVEYAIAGLQRVGLCVNTSKSYVRSNFRESCGGDYFYGNDVAPVRLRLQNSEIDIKGTHLSGGNRDMFLVALERHARELVLKQLYSAAEFCYRQLERFIGTELPLVSEESPYLGRLASRDAVLNSLQNCENGEYAKVDVFVPTPDIRRLSDDKGRMNALIGVRSSKHGFRLNLKAELSGLRLCPQRFLHRCLTKVGNDGMEREERLYFDQAAMPRSLVLRRVRVSGFALT